MTPYHCLENPGSATGECVISSFPHIINYALVTKLLVSEEKVEFVAICFRIKPLSAMLSENGAQL